MKAKCVCERNFILTLTSNAALKERIVTVQGNPLTPCFRYQGPEGMVWSQTVKQWNCSVKDVNRNLGAWTSHREKQYG